MQYPAQTPLINWGSNMRTHRLKKVEPERWEFCPTPQAWLAGGFFVMAGMMMMILGVSAMAGLEPVDGGGLLFFFGLFAAGGGLGLLWHFNQKIIFDRASGYYWRIQMPMPPWQAQGVEEKFALEDIEALQLLRKFVVQGRYYSYELNLVLTDGRRINVQDQWRKRQLTREAEALASFLARPLLR
jgi:hypothetical protein